MLIRNLKEKGGTGKLRSYWEDGIFTVVKKKDNLPVYTIKHLNKDDVRVVHRNLLMKCN